MPKNGRVIAGILLFLALVSFPFIYNLSSQDTGANINLNTPEIQKLKVKQCIESTDYMRANHMQLLLQWRDESVREDKRIYINSRGESYEKSIDTCLKCHNDPQAPPEKQFCVSCHEYAAVKPDCRQCHSWPGMNEHAGAKKP